MLADASYSPSLTLYMRIRLASVIAATSLFALACGGGETKGGTTGPVTPVPTTVIVTPQNQSIEVGSTQTFAAEVRDQNGVTMAGQTVAWSTGSTSIATVNSSGVVTGVGA